MSEHIEFYRSGPMSLKLGVRVWMPGTTLCLRLRELENEQRVTC
jgi:hypothetical protein